MAEFEPGPFKADLERRTAGAVDALKHDLGSLRTGRANTSLLDTVHVEVYGSAMPLSQVATVTAPEPRMPSVQAWDKSNGTPGEKGLSSARLGRNRTADAPTRLLAAERGGRVAGRAVETNPAPVGVVAALTSPRPAPTLSASPVPGDTP